jgi:Rrf2 family nitric oxide-sensitive transcriptional repressor
MQINVTTDYGLRVILYLAHKQSVASSSEICGAMGIPLSYMYKVTRVLKKIGVLREIRGTAGGFLLIKELRNVSLLSVVLAFEKTMNINRCLEEDEFCSRDATSYCKVRKFYDETQTELHKKLDIPLSNFM